MSGPSLTVAILGDIAPLRKALKDADSDVAGFGKGLGGIGGGLGGLIGPATLAAGAIAGVGIAIGSMTLAASEDAASQARLEAAIRANGGATGEWEAAMEAAIGKAQELAFTDDAARDAMTRLVTSTNDVAEAANLMGVAQDLARLKGIDLASAAEIVGKAHDGSFTALKKMGIVLEEGATATEALAAVQAAAAGQAETYAGTTEGGLTKMGIAFDELQESIGSLFLPVLEAILPVITDVVLPALKQLVTWVGEKVQPIFVKLQPLLAKVGEVLAAIAPPILDILGPAFDLLAGWIGVQVDAFILLIDWLGQAWDAFMRGITVVSDFVSDMGELPGKIVAVFADAGQWLLDAGVSVVQGLIDGILSMAGAVLDAILSLIPEPIRDAVSDILGLSGGTSSGGTFGYGTAELRGAYGGGTTVGSPVSITVHTSGDPQAVEQAVVSALRRYGRLNGVQIVG
jgi:hypothetical protein